MLTGACHCGTVRWQLESSPRSATACNCTICAKSGVLWVYGVEGEDVHVTGPTQCYLRNDSAALEFNFCASCGNTISWRLREPNENGKTTCALNLRLVDDPESVLKLPIRHFDGLETFSSLPEDNRTVKDMWF